MAIRMRSEESFIAAIRFGGFRDDGGFADPVDDSVVGPFATHHTEHSWKSTLQPVWGNK